MSTTSKHLLQNSKTVRLTLGYTSINVEFVFETPRVTVLAFNELVKLTVIAQSVDGKKSISVQQEGPVNEPAQLGKLVADELKEKGITELAINWREKVEEWNKK